MEIVQEGVEVLGLGLGCDCACAQLACPNIGCPEIHIGCENCSSTS